MIPRSNLEDVVESSELVLDASVLINLLGTGMAAEILDACEFKCSADGRALAELLRHPRPDGNLKVELETLEKKPILHRLRIAGAQVEEFVNIAGAEAPNDIGDGEAATIVQAHTLSAVAVVDDRKARRAATERYSDLILSTTADLLAHRSVVTRLGEKQATYAFGEARKYARMSIPERYQRWFSEAFGEVRL